MRPTRSILVLAVMAAARMIWSRAVLSAMLKLARSGSMSGSVEDRVGHRGAQDLVGGQ